MSKMYLVPHDFSAAADSAVQHALNLARETDAGIRLLHVVKADNEVAANSKKLQEVANALNLADGDPVVDTKVIVGSIFEDIGKIASFSDTQLIVMGTHGAKGMQRLFGSYALKVITSSHIPFLVVQEDKKSAPGCDKIVMPLNLAKESAQVLKFAEDLATHFSSEIHIVVEHQKDEWLINKIRNNILMAKKHMAERGVTCKVDIMPGKMAFNKEVVEYAKDNGADLLAVGYFSESLLPQFDTFAQSLLVNEANIPVLIVNAEAVGSVSGQYSFIGV